MKILPREFYNRDTTVVATDLLGKYLVHKINGIERIGKIVEVEAYLGEHDLACHSSKGVTNRTKIMFGPSGYAYVYLIYGIHHCFNIVTEQNGNGTAVLIRALEPIDNIDKKTNGPGLLCKAMGIDKNLNGHDLVSYDLFVARSSKDTTIIPIKKAPRVGVGYAGVWADKLLRFYIKGNPFVSKR